MFVAIFAVLLASHPARNSNLWLHLAAGRDLTRADASPGLSTDPIVQRAWAYHLTLYWLHRIGGDTGLLLAKALLVAALGLLLFGSCRTRAGWWVSVSCTALALLAMSTRLLLQPVTVSYLFLALALWFVRPRQLTERSILPPPWPLLLLFVLWANIDVWFVIGLPTLALVWLGQALDLTLARASDPTGKSRLSPFLQWPIAVGLLTAVCLLNPSVVRVFALPQELSWLGDLGIRRANSPFRAGYFNSVGLTPSGLAFFPLFGLSLLSFGMNRRGWRWKWVLPWLGLAILSCVEARVIPFFAIVAGPILAWNLAEVLERSQTSGRWRAPRWRILRGYCSVLGIGLAIALLICAWPGWLQGRPFEPRRWAVDLPVPPIRGAEAVRLWHEREELTSKSRILHLSAETAHAFAWGCPEVRGVWDPQLAAALRREPGAPTDWQERMRTAGIDHVIVYDRSPSNLSAILSLLSSDPDEWPLLFAEGGLAIFGWRDPKRRTEENPFGGRELNLEELAFRSDKVNQAPSSPPQGQPISRRWWDAFWKPVPVHSIDRDEATLYALYAESLRRGAFPRHRATWEAGQAAGLIGTAGVGSPSGCLTDVCVRLALFRPGFAVGERQPNPLFRLNAVADSLRQSGWRTLDDTPPALLYLTVRAARRAVAVDPNDARSYLLLGEAYLRLIHATRERVWASRIPEMGQLRMAQASAALNRAIALRPDLAQAHLSLGGLYRDLGYLDLAVQHFRTYLALEKKSGPPPGVDATAFREEAAQFESGLDQLTQLVADRGNQYDAESAGKRVLIRASIAKEKGLAKLALDQLLQSDIAAFGFDGLLLELELLLGTGRASDVLEWTDLKHKEAIGSAYHWLRAQSKASLGEYPQAREDCDALAAALEPDAEQGRIKSRELITGLVARTVLDGQPKEGGIGPFLYQAFTRAEALTRLARYARILRQQADLWTLRGLIALEQGEVGEADDAFRQALSLWNDGEGLDFKSRAAAQGYLAMLESARLGFR